VSDSCGLSNQHRFICPTRANSVLAVLGRQMAENPTRTILNFLRPARDGIEIQPLTLETLAIRAQRARARLAGAGLRFGDRVILSLSDPRDFLAWIVACFSSRLVAVPIPSAGEMSMPAAFLSRVTGVLSDCSAAAVIVENRARWSAVTADLCSKLPVFESGEIHIAVPAQETFEPFVDQLPNVMAFLQYTSGSTGSPKGVVITHANLMANCEAARIGARFVPEDHMVSWLPLHHDMGLVGSLFVCINAGMTTSIMTPLSFLGRPLSWIRAIDKLRATISVGPTFGYSLCVQKIPPEQIRDLDLSCWRLAFVGAEPVTRSVLTAFAERFSPVGFSPSTLFPVYGLAEATLAATFPKLGEGPHFDRIDRNRLAAEGKAIPCQESESSAMWITSVGTAIPGHHVKIISPNTRVECDEREVGEVVFSGDSMSTHYFGQPPETHRSELNTGDLGYMAQGRLYIIDRRSDLVIVAGHNYASCDIEAAIVGIPDVHRGMAVAFSVPGRNGTEALVIVAEMDPKSRRSVFEVEEDIRQRVHRRTGLIPETVHLAPKGTIEKTTSGKLRRRECRRQFETGQLPYIKPAERMWLSPLRESLG
jgi:fatty-acyl-CoA synthase